MYNPRKPRFVIEDENEFECSLCENKGAQLNELRIQYQNMKQSIYLTTKYICGKCYDGLTNCKHNDILNVEKTVKCHGSVVMTETLDIKSCRNCLVKYLPNKQAHEILNLS